MDSYKSMIFSPATPTEISTEYFFWNKAIADYFFSRNGGANGDIYLTITPQTLSNVFAMAGGALLSPEDASARFANSVSKTYQALVISDDSRLKNFRQCGDDEIPLCTAFLALSVLAAYEMHHDDDAIASGYYRRFVELLQCEMAVTNRPKGFETDEFEVLWKLLSAWLLETRKLNLALPTNAGFRKFIAYPLTHVPLRKVDVEQLPSFFSWAGYEPGRIQLERLDEDLKQWMDEKGVFTAAGVSALADDRRKAVLTQIAKELESWDGSSMDAYGRSNSIVELLVEPNRQNYELYFLPRQPPAFPSVFDDGIHVFEGCQNGWYEQVRVSSSDGADLLNGFAWTVDSGTKHYSLKRKGFNAIALVPSDEFPGFISSGKLLPGVRCAVLCHADKVEAVRQYLENITGQKCNQIQFGLPEGWSLFINIKAVNKMQPPLGLESLLIESEADISMVGGLRLGKGRMWLQGALPKLQVTRLDSKEGVLIDGKSVTVNSNNMIEDEGILTTVGIHWLEIAGKQKRVEIVEPKIPEKFSMSLDLEEAKFERAIPIPRGTWTLLGAKPGEVKHVVNNDLDFALVSCLFEAVWAVSGGHQSKASVLSLMEKGCSPKREAQKSTFWKQQSVRTWALAIYDTAIRRPKLAGGPGVLAVNGFEKHWADYVKFSKEIKKKLKARL